MCLPTYKGNVFLFCFQQTKESHQPPNHHGTHTTYPAIIPYIPPYIWNINNSDCSSDNSSQCHSEFVEIPVITRSYNTLESHFSEEPMTSIDTDSPPPSSYNVSEVMKNWGESTSMTDKTVSVHDGDDKTDSSNCDNKENNSVLVDSLSNYNNNSESYDILKHELLSDSVSYTAVFRSCLLYI